MGDWETVMVMVGAEGGGTGGMEIYGSVSVSQNLVAITCAQKFNTCLTYSNT